jgi:hypothetical protein
MKTIRITAAPEEVLSWKRSIHLEVDGKKVYIRLWWDEDRGFEFADPDFQGEWSEDESAKFYDWLRGANSWGFSNLEFLDEITSDPKDFGRTIPLETN